ncbi:MAG: glycosyltransferase family 2 protein [Candidatus Omnitrophica bacterium]|nr:glycosyltransferase family 2 protein [Candidatus Omnitrophota bacterium]
MTRLLISVIIITYNRSFVIKRAIESVLKQTYKDLEIILIDDASSDNTHEIISSITDDRVKLVRHDKNKGVAVSRNTGLKNSKGEFITFLDDDDEWLPEKLQTQLDLFKKLNSDVGLIYTNGFSEDEGRIFITERINSKVIYDPSKDKFFPLRVLITPPSSWMLPMEVIKRIGYFDEAMYNNWDDGDYFVRIARKYKIYFLNKNLVTWHILKSHVNMVTPELIKGKEVFLKKNFELLKKDKGYLFRFYRTMGKDSLKLDKKRARYYLLKALCLRTFDLSVISKIARTFG